ncbi:MAG: ferritin-like domain-containing protein [Firmicutes bacterium]|nr:ferritin-like domain-containing protein [Bacillota bacterium]
MPEYAYSRGFEWDDRKPSRGGGTGYREDSELVPDIEKAINGQYSAINCYAQLAERAPNQEERERILEIRKDEIRHYQTFTGIYRELTGKKPSPRMVGECPEDYRKGLRASLQDEQKTVDFYLDIADQAKSAYIKKRFKRAAADEQNHAVWFLYFLTSGGSAG